MGIEQAVQRVSELQAMAAQGVGASAPAAAPAGGADQQAFAAMLAQQMQQQPGGAMPGALMPAAGGAAGMGLAPAPGMGMPYGMQGMPGLGAPVPAAAPTMVSGDLEGLDPHLLQKLDAVGQQLGTKLEVISGLRSREEQERLYAAYLNGTGNLAAKPGTSNHEHGGAADVYVNGVALANVPGAREAAAQAGLGFPVPGEAWHVEEV